jgi:hypothetical protein
LHIVTDAGCASHSAFSARGVALRSFAAKNSQTLENNREKIHLFFFNSSFAGILARVWSCFRLVWDGRVAVKPRYFGSKARNRFAWA